MVNTIGCKTDSRNNVLFSHCPCAEEKKDVFQKVNNF